MNVKEVSFLFSWFGVSKNYYTNIIPFCECVCERERERERPVLSHGQLV